FKLLFLIIALVLYALLLMPGFIRVGGMIVYYFFSPDVVRGVMYGSKPRQRLDLYFPRHARDDVTYPVVVYVTGGAWTIGYKAWGALLARRLSEQGVLVACLDYRNFPQGDALDMLEDVNTGISWVLSRIHRFGGDPDSVTLVGQSAGGHLAGLALIKQVGKGETGGGVNMGPASRLAAFVGVSGAFDLVGLAAHRGDIRSNFRRGMWGWKRPAYDTLSPLQAARRLPPGAAGMLPYVLLIHGTADKTVPAEGSAQLCEALQSSGAPSCRCLLIPGKTHTAFLLEDPMRGGRDLLMDTVLGAVKGSGDSAAGEGDLEDGRGGGSGRGIGGGDGDRGGAGTTGVESGRMYSSLCPAFLCNLAGRVCPF
ncbi:hypothetical protein VOLCADRAFT_66089, partial [Volvox carteri f. nagariensis]